MHSTCTLHAHLFFAYRKISSLAYFHGQSISWEVLFLELLYFADCLYRMEFLYVNQM